MSELLKRMRKASKMETAVISESVMFNEKDIVKTSIPVINIAFSGRIDGGITDGITVLAGPSRTYKSNIGLECVAAYLNQYSDAICLFYDSEFGTPLSYLESKGIDLNRVLHTPIVNIEELTFDLVSKLEEIKRGDKVIIFIDSVGNLASKKEQENALNENTAADMTRAKALKSLFRIITPHFKIKNIPCIVINHTYQSMSLYPTAIVSGGCLSSGTNIKTSSGLTPIEDIKIGDFVHTKEGLKEVSYVWDPQTLADGTPECYEIEFDDGYTVICSDEHSFLVDGKWTPAKSLTVGDDVLKI